MARHTCFTAIIRLHSLHAERDDFPIEQHQTVTNKATDLEDVDVDGKALKTEHDGLARLDEAFKGVAYVSGNLGPEQTSALCSAPGAISPWTLTTNKNRTLPHTSDAIAGSGTRLAPESTYHSPVGRHMVLTSLYHDVHRLLESLKRGQPILEARFEQLRHLAPAR